jgi:hypothetical protein
MVYFITSLFCLSDDLFNGIPQYLQWAPFAAQVGHMKKYILQCSQWCRLVVPSNSLAQLSQVLSASIDIFIIIPPQRYV